MLIQAITAQNTESSDSLSTEHIYTNQNQNPHLSTFTQFVATYLRCLLDELLNVILTETAMAGVVDLAEERDWLGFADGDDFNLIGAAAGAFGSLRHAVEDRPESQ